MENYEQIQSRFKKAALQCARKKIGLLESTASIKKRGATMLEIF